MSLLLIDTVIRAKEIISKLPLETVWAFTVTNEDSATSPAALNIYCAKEEWTGMHLLLGLDPPDDSHLSGTGETFLSYKKDALCVSFIDTGDTDE